MWSRSRPVGITTDTTAMATRFYQVEQFGIGGPGRGSARKWLFGRRPACHQLRFQAPSRRKILHFGTGGGQRSERSPVHRCRLCSDNGSDYADGTSSPWLAGPTSIVAIMTVMIREISNLRTTGRSLEQVDDYRRIDPLHATR